MQFSEKFSPIVTKIGISSSATSIVLHTKRKLLTRKLSKQQLTAHTSIVKRYMQSVTNTHQSLQSALLWSLVLAHLLTFMHKTQYK